MKKDMNAIDKVRQMVADGQVSQEVAEKYFPELKERDGGKTRERLIAFLSQCKSVYGDSFKQFELNIDEALDWLEKQGEQKPTWDEDDKLMFQCAITHFECQKRNCIDGCDTKEAMQEFIDWLYSLKDRYTWKPSCEQIIALRWVLNNIPYNKHKEEISGLLDQIKDFV